MQNYIRSCGRFSKQLELTENEYHFTGYGRRQEYFIRSQLALMSVSKLILLYVSGKSTMSRCKPDSEIKKAKEDMVNSLKKWHSTLRESCIKNGVALLLQSI